MGTANNGTVVVTFTDTIARHYRLVCLRRFRVINQPIGARWLRATDLGGNSSTFNVFTSRFRVGTCGAPKGNTFARQKKKNNGLWRREGVNKFASPIQCSKCNNVDNVSESEFGLEKPNAIRVVCEGYERPYAHCRQALADKWVSEHTGMSNTRSATHFLVAIGYQYWWKINCKNKLIEKKLYNFYFQTQTR